MSLNVTETLSKRSGLTPSTSVLLRFFQPSLEPPISQVILRPRDTYSFLFTLVYVVKLACEFQIQVHNAYIIPSLSVTNHRQHPSTHSWSKGKVEALVDHIRPPFQHPGCYPYVCPDSSRLLYFQHSCY
jgi:hypothetical protein